MTIRDAGPADAGGIARVHVSSWRSTYRGMVPEDYLASLSVARREERWREILTPPHCEHALVAVSDVAGIVGFASGGKERSGDPLYTGEIFGLYLLASHQRRGIGRRLVARMAHLLWCDGHREMLIWVLAENPSRLFYEALGGAWLREQPIVIGGRSLIEVAYGWEDLPALFHPMGTNEKERL